MVTWRLRWDSLSVSARLLEDELDEELDPGKGCRNNRISGNVMAFRKMGSKGNDPSMPGRIRPRASPMR